MDNNQSLTHLGVVEGSVLGRPRSGRPVQKRYDPPSSLPWAPARSSRSDSSSVSGTLTGQTTRWTRSPSKGHDPFRVAVGPRRDVRGGRTVPSYHPCSGVGRSPYGLSSTLGLHPVLPFETREEDVPYSVQTRRSIPVRLLTGPPVSVLGNTDRGLGRDTEEGVG